MGMSPYMEELRRKIGTSLVLAPGAAAVIRDAEGRILLQRRSEDGTWSLPGGATDPGESPARTVLREVWEETGLRVVPERVLAVMGAPEGFGLTYRNGDVVEYTAIIFACRPVGGALAPGDGETLELRYFRPDALPPLRIAYPQWIFEESDPARPTHFLWDEAWLDALE